MFIKGLKKTVKEINQKCSEWDGEDSQFQLIHKLYSLFKKESDALNFHQYLKESLINEETTVEYVKEMQKSLYQYNVQWYLTDCKCIMYQDIYVKLQYEIIVLHLKQVQSFNIQLKEFQNMLLQFNIDVNKIQMVSSPLVQLNDTKLFHLIYKKINQIKKITNRLTNLQIHNHSSFLKTIIGSKQIDYVNINTFDEDFGDFQQVINNILNLTAKYEKDMKILNKLMKSDRFAVQLVNSYKKLKHEFDQMMIKNTMLSLFRKFNQVHKELQKKIHLMDQKMQKMTQQHLLIYEQTSTMCEYKNYNDIEIHGGAFKITISKNQHDQKPYSNNPSQKKKAKIAVNSITYYDNNNINTCQKSNSNKDETPIPIQKNLSQQDACKSNKIYSKAQENCKSQTSLSSIHQLNHRIQQNNNYLTNKPNKMYQNNRKTEDECTVCSVF